AEAWPGGANNEPLFRFLIPPTPSWPGQTGKGSLPGTARVGHPPRCRGYGPTVRDCNPSRDCPGAWGPCWKQPFGAPLGGGLAQPPPQDPLRRDPFRWAHWPGMMAGRRWGLTGPEFRNGFPPETPPTIRRGHSVPLAEIVARVWLEISAGNH